MKPITKGASRFASAVAAALAIVVVVSVAGCGSSGSGKTASPSAAAATAKVGCVAVHQFGGDEKSDHVTALCLIDSVLYVGTKKRLFTLTFDAAAKKFEPSPVAQEGGGAGTEFEINAIRKAGSRVLVATNDGCTIRDGKSWSAESMGPVNDIVSYGDTIWIGRNRGLEKRSGQDWREEKVPAIKLNPTLSSRIRGLAVTPDERLWVGSEFGIYSFVAKEKRWGNQLYGDFQNILNDVVTNEKGNSDLCGNQINRLEVDPASGKLLICTQRGLSVFDGAEAWKTFQGDYEILSTESGTMTRQKKKGNCELPSPNVTAAAMVGGVLWVGSPGGLGRVEGEKTELFDSDHGLPASAITALAHDPVNGVLYVGTEKGLGVLGPVVAPAPAASAKP